MSIPWQHKNVQGVLAVCLLSYLFMQRCTTKCVNAVLSSMKQFSAVGHLHFLQVLQVFWMLNDLSQVFFFLIFL